MTLGRGVPQRRLGLALLGCSMLALCPMGRAVAQESGEAVTGHQLARRWCVSCHVIDSSQPAASVSGAPSFPAIAHMPSTTGMSLHAFLLTPHAPMPDFQLSRNDIDNVTAYILSLKETSQ